jgi:voltage-gated potassium channel
LREDKDNLMVTVTARHMNHDLKIVARCMDARMMDKLVRAGATSAVSPNMIGGLRLVSELVRPHVVTFLDLMMRQQAGTMRVSEVHVGEGSPWIGKNLQSIDLHRQYELLALALRKPDGKMVYNPHSDSQLESGDVIVVMGEERDTWKAREAAGETTPHRPI